MKERVDLLEVDGEKFVASYEENTIPGKKDARVLEYGSSDKSELDNPLVREEVGEVYSIDEQVAEDNESAIDYLEMQLAENQETEEDPFAMDGLDTLSI